jgi:hypothetical protein
MLTLPRSLSLTSYQFVEGSSTNQAASSTTHHRRQPWSIWPAIGGKVSGLDQLHCQPRFLAGGGKALVHGGE